jgi:hypothetical protein
VVVLYGACAGRRRWGCRGRSQAGPWARKRAALWAVAWSLARQQQGYMLAQIESELNAPDRAVEGLVGEFGDDGSGVVLFFLKMMI